MFVVSNDTLTFLFSLQCSDGVKLAAQSWQQHQETHTNPITRILCLHGWMDNCRSFARLGPALASKLPAQVVALDFPGHGWSDPLPHATTVQAELAYYVAETIRALDWPHCIIIGHSMGAAATLWYAAAFPERVSSFVLLDGAGPLTRDPLTVARQVRSHITKRQEEEGQEKAKRVYPSLEKAIQVRCFTAKSYPGDQWLSTEASREMVERGTVSVEGGGVSFRHDPRLQWPSLVYTSEAQVQGLYQSLKCPRALFLGQDGWPFTPELLQIVLDGLQPAVFEKLPGSHHLHADPDSAGALAEHVLKFIQDHLNDDPPPAPLPRSKH